jgi:hypothetical protein
VAQSVTIDGYLSGGFVGSITVSLSTTQWSSSGGIDGLVDTLVFTSGGQYFRMDDFEAVLEPEPATAALFGDGLLGLTIVMLASRAARKRERVPRHDRIQEGP